MSCGGDQHQMQVYVKYLKVTNIQQYYRHAMQSKFKLHTWLFWSWDCSLFKLYESAGTRGHPFRLHKKTVLTNQYAHFYFLFFANRVIKSWDSLPSNNVLVGTLNSFRILLNKHWKLARSCYAAFLKRIMLSITETKTRLSRQKAKKPTSHNLIRYDEVLAQNDYWPGVSSYK